MKMKKILSLLLAVVMISGIFAFGVFADDEVAIKTYITISKYGKIVDGKDGSPVAAKEVELTGQSEYTLDDLFKTAHNLFYEGGAEAGYSSYMSDWGLSVGKLWGDESGNFGYEVNGAKAFVSGLSHTLNDGDYVDAAVFESYYPDTESYTKFGDFKTRAEVGEDVELTFYIAGYDEYWNKVFSACEGAEITVNGEKTGKLTDAEGKAVISVDKPGEYVISAEKTKQSGDKTVTAITAPVCILKTYSDAKITVPEGTELYVGQKGSKHFVSFTEIEPEGVKENEGNRTYYYALENNKVYNYRVTSDEYVTYAGKFKKTADFGMDITEEMLKEGEKTGIDRNLSSNNGYNVGDIYLNINAKGYLTLDEGDTFGIVNLRNWEAVDSVTANYFIEPDYHYTVIDENGNVSENVVTVDENGLVTAVGEGTAIVLVTYDAINIDFGSGAVFYGAIWPENTGVFVVSVGAETSGIDTGMTINEGKNSDEIKLSGDALDSEHDVIYFVGDSGSYTFSPVTEGLNVYVSNPIIENDVLTYDGFENVDKNKDGSFSVPLSQGRNIVKLEKDGKAEYQIITAKKLNISINNGEEVHPGDEISVVLDTVYHPANKLAGVYNMNANAVYTDVPGYEDKIIGGLSAQYNFASNQGAQTVSNVLKEKNTWGAISYQKDTELTVPADYNYDTFTLSGGMVYVSGFGDSYGNHRAITYENGKGANLNAQSKAAWLGSLPDIDIPVIATNAELSSISLDTENVKKDYYSGDKFDTENLTVTAHYADDKEQIAKNYTVTPEILNADTKKVTVSYKGKTAEIDVNVKVPLVKEIELTKAPDKLTYKEGETFDPTGMVITAVYENGDKKAVSDYTYSPNDTLKTTDTEMLITYTGEDKADEISAISVPITVTDSSSGGSSSNNISVYFTLYGDKKHGEPKDSSDTHTMSAKNLTEWISKTKVTVPKGSTVLDVTAKALSLAGIPYTNEDNYISSVRGLKEFDNGALSGWMYTLNGKYPSLGVAEQKVSDGDKIVFHYTDDYTQEKTSYSGASGGGGTKKTEKTVTDNEDNKTEDNNTDNSGKQETKGKKFKDTKGHWAEKDIEKIVEKGIMKGISEEEFSPDTPITRAMFVTVLYRLEGEPKAGKAAFSDIESGSWYENAVGWASENNLVNGISSRGFEPNEEITREQLVTMLYRYAKFKGYRTDIGESDFTDNDEISDWAKEAVLWAVKQKIIFGTDENKVLPAEASTRAQAAVMIIRFLNNFTEV